MTLHRRFLSAGAALAALALVATPALADWAPTRWGMTVAQVVASVPGAAQVSRKRDGGQDVWEHHRLAVAPAEELGFPVSAEFYFTPNARNPTLAFVRLLPVDTDQCVAFRQALVARYGAGNDVSSSNELTGMTWTDPATGDRLRFTMYAPDDGSYRTCFAIRQQPE